MRTIDIVARLGGDEFAIALCNMQDISEAILVAERVVKEIGRPYQIENLELCIGASIGIANYPADGQTAKDLFIAADLALYTAKDSGRGTFRLFAANMNQEVQERHQIEADMREGLANHEFQLHYQPIINLKTNAITRFEALARWFHPTKGFISPDKFIPVAEQTGLIHVLGEWALRKACIAATRWPRHVGVAVNLSPSQFTNQDLVGCVERILSETGLEPERLELEITEGLLMHNTTANLEILRGIKNLGVRIAMDDFGTGFSSLSYLQSFPFDRIKIDRRFVSKLGGDASSKAVVQAVINMAVAFNMRTTAEGVETEEQCSILVALGCNAAQGYLFCRPVPEDQVAKEIAQRLPKLLSAA